MKRIFQIALRLLFPPVNDEAPLLSPERDTPDSLADLQRRIEAAKTRFSMSANDEETEATIYELNALEARYRLLLRRARAGS